MERCAWRAAPAITLHLSCSYEELHGWHWNLTPEQLEVESDADPAQPHPWHYGGWMRKALRVAAKAALGGFTVRIGICLLLLMAASPCLP